MTQGVVEHSCLHKSGSGGVRPSLVQPGHPSRMLRLREVVMRVGPRGKSYLRGKLRKFSLKIDKPVNSEAFQLVLALDSSWIAKCQVSWQVAHPRNAEVLTHYRHSLSFKV